MAAAFSTPDKQAHAARDSQNGLKIENFFCPPGTKPFDQVTWEKRTAAIKGDGGEVVFKQDDCEVPAAWSQLATNVVASKYFYGEKNSSEREHSVRDLVHRVTRTITDWAKADGVFATEKDAENFYTELTWLCINQYGAFNSPVWFNVGLYHQKHINGSHGNFHWDPATRVPVKTEKGYEYPQGSACFIQSVDDTMEDIMRLVASEAMLFKYGSGTGTDLSTLRSSKETLAGGGKPSGPLSFMRVFDQVAAVVKSGGKTRRAAKMQSLKVSHPDIMEFIECKAKEEKKARALMDAGYAGDYNGEAYSSVMYQNANLSVRLTDEFLAAAIENKDWETWSVTKPRRVMGTHKAAEMLRKIADGAHLCGDPGVQYHTTVNRWHTCPNSGEINGSNPCSEYMFVDNSACNLASLNLMKFRRPDGSFDAAGFRRAVRIFIIAQETLVDHASYPTEKICRNSHEFRPLGLGYANLGAMLMSLGYPYDSDCGRSVAAAVTSVMTAEAYSASAELASRLGTFSEFPRNRQPMLNVMAMHRSAVEKIEAIDCSADLIHEARAAWDEAIAVGMAHGYRNAQTTLLAPTGTIGFLMDCDTTGVEPDIALVKYKLLAGGGMFKLVNRTVPLALEKLGYGKDVIAGILQHIEENDTIEGAPGLKDEHLAVFDCAFRPAKGTRSINYMGHLRMMAAVQPFLSGAISKTVNMPKDTTIEEIREVYVQGWKMGLKAVAIYRDGSKLSQPLNVKKGKKDAKPAAAPAEPAAFMPHRHRLPETRSSITHKFDIAGHEGYLTVGLYEDGTPGEVFLTMAKEGSIVGGMADAFATSISLCLQYGVPLEALVRKFSHQRFEPNGMTTNRDIPFAKSIVDYIFRWLGHTFLSVFKTANAVKRPVKAAPEGVKDDGAAPETSSAGRAANTEAAAPGAASGGAYVGEDGGNGNGNGEGGNGASVRKTIATRATRLEPAMLAERVDQQFRHFQEDAPACDVCGSITVRNGNCYKCYNCGSSLGCS
jgi:ribonucleoside-diphosphate reductase alpha chain